LALSPDKTKISGMAIISHSETPGLGGRIAENWFLKQFRDEKIFTGKIVFTKTEDGKGNYNSDDGQIDTITGASRTSELLAIIINKAISDLKSLDQ
jgi:Na+-transporting NADH:ubiquinone oxidoreductase subunit C